MTKAAYDLPLVRAQYEEFPYPHRDPADEKTRLVLPYFSRMDAVSHHCYGGKQDFRNFRVLIAGGGTGDGAIAWAEQLAGRDGCSVTYLDMSKSSMDVAQQRAAIRKLDNITWINDNILSIPTLDLGKFDFVQCTGVLHHLKDPDLGLRILTDVLKPEGAINLMVYAPGGRMGVYQVQNMMRLINGGEKDTSRQIDSTKRLLKSLPPHHWYNASRNYGWNYVDAENDAGVYDLFLHTQDRPFTILEVHDWLERCGLRMTSEPGYCYRQLSYLPEMQIKDPVLLAQVQQHPKKMQQAIAEAISMKLDVHEFFAVHSCREDRVASITDTRLIPVSGQLFTVSLEQMAEIARGRTDSFVITPKNEPEGTVSIPAGKYTTDILLKIDGQRSVEEIVTAVMRECAADRAAVMGEFEALFMTLNRVHTLYLRDPATPGAPTAWDMQKRQR